MNNSILSPVKFSSPGNYKSPRSGNANPPLALANQRLLTIVKQLISHHEKWVDLQKRGLVVCNAIERCKSKLIESSSKVESLYPDELKRACDKLQLILDNLTTIKNYCPEIRKQIDALKQLNHGSMEPIFRTWNFDDFLKFIDQIGHLYEQELNIKRTVMENIAHSVSKSILVMHVSVWEYPMYINSGTSLMFAILGKECL